MICDHQISLIFFYYRRSVEELYSARVVYNPRERKFQSQQELMAYHIFNLLFAFCPSTAGMAIGDVAGG